MDSTVTELQEDPWIPFREKVEKSLNERGLRLTKTRALIIETFFRLGQPVTTEEVLNHANQFGYGIEHATAHRTLNLLTEIGLSRVREFGAGAPRYEVAEGPPPGLLICERCLAVVVLASEQIHTFYESVAAENGFRLTSHRTELHGVCASCEGK